MTPQEYFGYVNNDCVVNDMCCVGARSSGGANRWKVNNGCSLANYKHGLDIHHYYNIGDLVHTRVRKVISIGDSMSRQIFDAMVCEAARLEGLTVTHDFSVRRKKAYWKFGVGDRTRYTVKSDTNDTLILESWADHAINTDVDDRTIRELCSQEDLDMVVFNFGLHYRSQVAYTKAMDIVARDFKLYCPVTTHLVFRTTSAQHFKTYDSEFENAAKVRPCVPHTDVAYDWRTDIARNAFTKNNLSVSIVDFWEMTKDLYDMHVPGDCTHFCSVPQIWSPVINGIVGIAGPLTSNAHKIANKFGMFKKTGYTEESVLNNTMYV